MNRRTVIIALLLALLGGLAIPGTVCTRADSSFLNVSISSSYPGDAPAYTLTFLTDTAVQKGSTLTLTFDTGVGCTGGLTVPASTLVLDKTAIAADAQWSGTQLTVTTPVDLAAGTEHTLVIAEDAGIQNPWTAGHYRVTLTLAGSTPAITSNYYTVSTATQLTPLSFAKIVEYGEITGVCVQFKTGRNGALVGHDLVRNAQGLMTYPSNEDTMTVRLSAGLSALWSTNGIATLQPNYAESPFIMKILSNTVYDTDEHGNDLRQLVLNLPHNIPANAQLSLSLLFASSSASLSEDEYVRVYTSKEPTLITVPPQTSGSGTGSGSGGGSSDTTPPVVTWNVQEDTLLPRLYTLTITIKEDNLDEAYLATGDDGWLHTYLAVGDNTVMLINRDGIKGTVYAVDKAGNTTSVPVDIPAPMSGS